MLPDHDPALDPTRDATTGAVPNPGTCRVRCRFPYTARPTAVAAALPLDHWIVRVEPWEPRRKARHRLARAAGAMQVLRLGAAGATTAALVGCAGLPSTQPLHSLAFAPVLRMDGGTWTADGAHAAGREALNQGRLHEALVLFERAAILRRGWDEPVNGQVVTLARLGRTGEAIDLARTAIAAGARAPELHGNLGLMLLRSGRDDDAWPSLEQAARLDPGNSTWVAALARRPADPPAAMVQEVAPAAAPALVRVVAPAAVPALEVAAAPAVVAVSMPAAAAPAVVAVTVPAAAPAAPAAPEPAAVRAPTAAIAAPQLRWDRSQSNVLALRMDMSPTVAVVAPAVDEPKPVQLAEAVSATPKLRFTIEVSNGAGQAGLAKGTATALRTAGVQPWRITNHAHYKVKQTEVQYRRADDAPAARQLASKLGVAVALVQNPNLHASVSLRVVLGKDLAALQPGKRVLAVGPEPMDLVAG